MKQIATWALAIALGAAGPALAYDWPEVTAAEHAMTSAPGAPNAPAVILEHSGRLVISERHISSHLDVYERIKILRPEGTDHGSVSILSTEFNRVKNLEARTILPDGSVVELPDDATFEKSYSRYYDSEVISFAMPQVVPGAIVEYHYSIYFDSLFSDPWYFQDPELPTVESQIACVVPDNYGLRPYVNRTLNLPVDQQTTKDAHGATLTFTMKNLPAVPDEPDSYPFSTLACRVVFVPQQTVIGRSLVRLATDWGDVVQLAEDFSYDSFRKDEGSVKHEAKQLARSIRSRHERAEKVYRFVRDDIATEPFIGVFHGDRHGDEVLARKRGDHLEKALMLQTMLDAVKVDASLCWTSPRTRRRIDPDTVDPSQVDEVLVVAQLDGKPVFLDPSPPDLPFGTLRAGYEDVPCLLLDRRKSHWVTTPSISAKDSGRLADLDLRISDDGRLSGSGRLVLTGHEGWRKVNWKATPEETTAAWHDWLDDRFPGLEVTVDDVTEKPEESRVEVAFSLNQPEEEVLGDEVSVPLAAPLALRNPYKVPPIRRLTPMQLANPYTDEVRLTVHWPDGWKVDSKPRLREQENQAGRLTTSLEVDSGSRTATVERVFTVATRELPDRTAYGAARALFSAAEQNDAEALVLVAE